MSTEFKRTEHSDILIHWTGKDIDAKDPAFSKTLPVEWRKHCLRPIDQPSLIKEPKLICEYVNRLRDILKFGLWMTADKNLDEIKKTSQSQDDGRLYETMDVAHVCFTELKLSESRQHAFEYGRLGIGVKRMFLFDRAGQPMIYVGETKGHEPKPNWFRNSGEIINDSPLKVIQQSFFKYMCEKEDLNYKYFSESEWRIAYSDDASKDDKCKVAKDFSKKIINVNGNIDEEIKKYANINQVKIPLNILEEFIKENNSKGLKFLIPLDYWLALIIYPCPAVKIAAERDIEIRRLLQKTRQPLPRNFDCAGLAKIGVGEMFMLPMEIDLDTISHF
jgi:hypothetical protein